jgi:tRNA pseudouridine38-40 synthase
VRLAVGIEYAGTRYAGWQRQDHAPSVQAEVEAALSRVADHEVLVTCAGRTDAGVHAVGQVVHFDTDARRALRSWVLGANVNLPNDIVVRYAAEVGDDFHARYSALSRSYRYVVLNRPVRPAVEAQRVAWIIEPLDVGRMRDGARHLVGEHDFSAFRAAQCQSKSPVRRLTELVIEQDGPHIVFRVTANAFLHHMVRNLVGTLLAVGTGEQPPDWVGEVLKNRVRAEAGITAPAGGLYLAGVRYPPAYGVGCAEAGPDSAMMPPPEPPASRWP